MPRWGGCLGDEMAHASHTGVMPSARFVEEISFYEPTPGQPRRFERLPDGRTVFVFHEAADGRGVLAVAGPRTRAHAKQTSGAERIVVVQFKPGWAPALLGVGASQLTDHTVSLEALWGSSARALLAELASADSAESLSARITQALAERLPHGSESASARLARRAVQLFEQGEGRVEAVATRLGVTARHLRRAFTEAVGVGPKEFARGVRLRRALSHTTASPDWGRIACDAGYYDQAHLVGEFRELMGVTPTAYVKSRRAGPAAQVPQRHGRLGVAPSLE